MGLGSGHPPSALMAQARAAAFSHSHTYRIDEFPHYIYCYIAKAGVHTLFLLISAEGQLTGGQAHAFFRFGKSSCLCPLLATANTAKARRRKADNCILGLGTLERLIVRETGSYKSQDMVLVWDGALWKIVLDGNRFIGGCSTEISGSMHMHLSCSYSPSKAASTCYCFVACVCSGTPISQVIRLRQHVRLCGATIPMFHGSIMQGVGYFIT